MNRSHLVFLNVHRNVVLVRVLVLRRQCLMADVSRFRGGLHVGMPVRSALLQGRRNEGGPTYGGAIHIAHLAAMCTSATLRREHENMYVNPVCKAFTKPSQSKSTSL